MAFVADDHFAVVLQPCEQTLDDPAASIATKFSSVLRVALDSIAPMWRNQLDSSLGQSFVESVGIICSISNKSLWLSHRETLVE